MKLVVVLALFVACKKAPVEPAIAGGSAVTTDAVTVAALGDAGVVDVAPPDAAIAERAARDAALVAISEISEISDAGKLRAEDVGFEADRHADILTASEPTIGEMSKRRPGADLASQIEQARGAGSGSGADAVRGALGRIVIASKTALETTTLTTDVLLSKIQSAYMAGFKRCYRTVLAQTPTAAGAVTIEFAVLATGRTVTPAVTAFEASLKTCLEGQIGFWRFPIPKGPDGEPTTATFRIGFALRPD